MPSKQKNKSKLPAGTPLAEILFSQGFGSRRECDGQQVTGVVHRAARPGVGTAEAGVVADANRLNALHQTYELVQMPFVHTGD